MRRSEDADTVRATALLLGGLQSVMLVTHSGSSVSVRTCVCALTGGVLTRVPKRVRYEDTNVDTRYSRIPPIRKWQTSCYRLTHPQLSYGGSATQTTFSAEE